MTDHLGYPVLPDDALAALHARAEEIGAGVTGYYDAGNRFVIMATVYDGVIIGWNVSGPVSAEQAERIVQTGADSYHRSKASRNRVSTH